MKTTDGSETSNRPNAASAFARRGGFTLIEVLVVMGIIILILAVAIPSFNAISGSRSIEGAQNQVSAILGRAREEAIGLQEVRGVWFFIDPRSGRINAAMVYDSGMIPETPPVLDSPPAATATLNYTNAHYLDLVADREFTLLPQGVGLQVVDNSAGNPRTDDGYLGYNTFNGRAGALESRTKYGGVILFDGSGRIITLPYGFRCRHPDPTTGAPLWNDMGRLLYVVAASDTTTPANRPNVVPLDHTNTLVVPPTSQVGFALYDLESYRSQGFSDADPQITGSGAYAPDELKEETWIDQNGVPLLVNRYSGTLIRGE